MNYTNSFFTENTKMAELVISNPTLMLTLSRFGIELGFGDQNVKEVCEKAKVSPSFFLLICNIYSNPEFIPSKDDIKSVEANAILAYLSESHKSVTAFHRPSDFFQDRQWSKHRTYSPYGSPPVKKYIPNCRVYTASKRFQ